MHAGIADPPGSRHPPCAVHAGRYGQQAGGTHPTGMLTCNLFILFFFVLTDLPVACSKTDSILNTQPYPLSIPIQLSRTKLTLGKIKGIPFYTPKVIEQKLLGAKRI